MTATYEQFTLQNGLTVFLKEIHTAPLISHWVWYRVGSRDEQQGRTGISHWVEHMQFKGTPRYPGGVLDKAIARTGGTWNAFTHTDWTTYYETLPAEQLDLALALEADRMVNSVYTAEEVDSERTVILSELAGSLNEPFYRLADAVQKAAFDDHPYRNEVIGTVEDLQSIQRDDLYAHYRACYHPANALVALAGDFDSREVLEKLQTLYADLPAGPPVAHPQVKAGPMPEERRIVLEGASNATYMDIAYRSPAAAEDDFFAFTVLNSLLCGPTSLNMFGGGGISNKTSRIYRALIEREITVSAHGSLQATIDPFMFELSMTLRPDRTPDQALAALDGQIARLQDELPSADEIARAVKQARAMFAYGSENITNQAFWLGYAEMFADYSWFTQYLERLEKITPQDVQRVAQTYLAPQQRVVGLFLPQANGGQS
jgi:zinc protease